MKKLYIMALLIISVFSASAMDQRDQARRDAEMAIFMQQPNVNVNNQNNALRRVVRNTTYNDRRAE